MSHRYERERRDGHDLLWDVEVHAGAEVHRTASCMRCGRRRITVEDRRRCPDPIDVVPAPWPPHRAGRL